MLYERLRKHRGERIVRETFAQRTDFHMRDGSEQQARDELILFNLGEDIDCESPSRSQRPIVQPYLYGYDDAKVEVENALRQHPLHCDSHVSSSTL